MTQPNVQSSLSRGAIADDELLKDFPGFKNNYSTVNGVTLHWVEGGEGMPLICLPEWPQTWYSYQPIALELATAYRVIIVDIRGMGSSEKPASGYDKKTMAGDILALVQELGFDKVHIMGHDIGGMVAAYNDADSIRASYGWYQTFRQDIEDAKSYQQLTMPLPV